MLSVDVRPVNCAHTMVTAPKAQARSEDANGAHTEANSYLFLLVQRAVETKATKSAS